MRLESRKTAPQSPWLPPAPPASWRKVRPGLPQCGRAHSTEWMGARGGGGEWAACSVQWKAWQRTGVRTCALAWEPAQHVLGASGPGLFRPVGPCPGDLRQTRLSVRRHGGTAFRGGTHFTYDVSEAHFAHFPNLPVLDSTSETSSVVSELQDVI